MTEDNINQLRETLGNYEDCDRAIIGRMQKDVDVCFFFHYYVFFSPFSL